MELSRSAHVDTFCRDNLPPAEQWPELIFELPELSYPDRLNAGVALLDDIIERHGPDGADRPCLHAPGKGTWTYGDLQTAANRVAHVLTDELGIVPGNRVLLRGPNNQWLTACWFGVLKAGAVAVTTMPLLRAGELGTIHEIGRVSAALCDHRFLDDLEGAGLDVPTMPFGGDSDDDLTHLVGAKPEHFDAVETAADDVALLAFTSGTTGRPKATMHFHRDVLAIADTFSRHVLKPSPGDVFVGTPPFAFTFGLGGLVVFPLHAGASTLLIEKATPVELADLIGEYGATTCFTAPTAYKAMIAAGNVDRLRSLHSPVSAGEHLPQAVSEAFHEATGVRIIDGIGSTEILHIFVSASGDAIRPGSTGVAVPGYVATVLDADGNEAPVDTPGRLAIKGPTGCRYLADERQQVYVQDGWNITGDTFRRDADGYFWYEARSDDMIVSSGYNIGAPEVEEGILAHPDVEECGVVGIPDADRGMVVKAFIVLRADLVGDEAKAKEIQDFTKQQIAPYKYPRVVEFVGTLPRTATGKLQRFRLRET